MEEEDVTKLRTKSLYKNKKGGKHGEQQVRAQCHQGEMRPQGMKDDKTREPFII